MTDWNQNGQDGVRRKKCQLHSRKPSCRHDHRHQRADVLSLEKRCRSLEPDQVCKLKQLQEENARLKWLVAELSLGKAKLQDFALCSNPDTQLGRNYAEYTGLGHPQPAR
jgi:hypothetical protein